MNLEDFLARICKCMFTAPFTLKQFDALLAQFLMNQKSVQLVCVRQSEDVL